MAKRIPHWAFLMLVLSIFLQGGLPGKEIIEIQHIFYACFEGELHSDLTKFWKVCQQKDTLQNEAVTIYPPHISLTDFFEQPLDATTFKKAVKEAIKEVKLPIDVYLENVDLIQKDKLHALYFQSEYLRRVTVVFARKVGIPSHLLKAKIGNPQYHLTLAHNFSPKAAKELCLLEKNIDFTKPFRLNLCLFQSERKGKNRKLLCLHKLKI